MGISEFQKWPTDKKKWDRNWLRIFGKKCWFCKGKGYLENDEKCIPCKVCGCIGYTEK